MILTAVDLFCGGGGSSAGARAAGFRMVGAVDAWDIATATYKGNFPSADVVTARLDANSGKALFKSGIDRVDLLIASPECTHHSIARGNKPRDEESRRSGWYIVKMIEELKPRWIVLENVLLMETWEGYSELKDHLGRASLGYNLRSYRLDAAAFGVPQNRRRLFLVGDRKAQPPARIETPDGAGVRTAREIISPKGTYKARPVHVPGRSQNTIDRFDKGVAALGRGVDFLIVYYGSDRAGGWQTLDRPLRTLTTLDRFGLVQWEGDTPTLRMLQVEELKRAMGLDDLRDEAGCSVPFRFPVGTRRDQVKILGNGVCAPVMTHVIRQLTEVRSSASDPRKEPRSKQAQRALVEAA